MSRETFILQQQSTVPAPQTGSLVREDSGVGQKDEPSKLQLLPLSGDALHLEWCGRHLMSGKVHLGREGMETGEQKVLRESTRMEGALTG